MDRCGNCPSCGVSFQGEPIPVEHRDKYYGGKTHFSRLIGISDMSLDCVVQWQCPDCGHTWGRDIKELRVVADPSSPKFKDLFSLVEDGTAIETKI